VTFFVFRFPILAFVLLLSAAFTFSLLAATNDTLPGDRATAEWLQDRSLPGQDLSDAVRLITGTEIVLATGAALALVLWLRGYRRQAVLLGAGLVALAILQPAIKELVDRPRPGPDVVEVRAGGSSPTFPGGHIMSGAFLYGSLLYFALTLPLARLPAILLASFCAVVIVFSAPVNVWLGVHWPSDVLGGWLWSAVLLLPLVVIDTYERAPDLTAP
jgi:undecaprenyl-diphosphatase